MNDPFAALNANFSQDRLNQFMKQQAARLTIKPQTPQVQPPKKNFWLDQISTAGGIIGGIAGAPLGLLGVGGGSAIGSGLGEALENILSGDSVGKNVAKEAAIGGVFGAGPAKLLKAGAGLVKGVAGRGVAEQVGGQALKTSLSGKLTSMGNSALSKQYGTIGKNVARETNPAKTVAQLADIGIIKPQDAERIGKAVTGADGILNRVVTTAVGEAGVVPTRNVKSVLQKAITSNGLVDKDAKSVVNVVNAQMKTLSNGSTPQQVIQVIRNLEKRAANLQGKGGNYRLSTPERVDQANALLAVRDELQDGLFKVAGANKNLASVLTPEVRSELLSLNPGNRQWQKFVDDTVMKAKDVNTLRSAQAPFVNIGKIIDEADMNAFTFGGRAGNALSGGSVKSDLLRALAYSPTGNRVLGNTLRAAGSGSNRLGVLGAQTPAGIASRLGTAGVARGIMNPAEANATSLEDALANQLSNNDSTTSNTTPSAYNMTPAATNSNIMDESYLNSQQTSSPYSRENLIADIQRDPENMAKYISYYQALEEVYNPPETEQDGLKLGNTAIARISDFESALTNLSDLESRIEQSGVNAPVLGDIRRRNPYDTEAQDLNSAIRSVRQLVGRALEGGVLRKEDEVKYEQMLPKIGDTDAAARAKLANVRQLLVTNLNAFKQNQSRYSGGGGLEDALLAQQTQQGAY